MTKLQENELIALNALRACFDGLSHLTPEEGEVEIQRILSVMPESEKAKNPNAVVAAMNYANSLYQAEKGVRPSSPSSPPPIPEPQRRAADVTSPSPSKRTVEYYIPPTLPSASKNKVNEILARSKDGNAKLANNAQISKLIIKYPLQTTYLAGKVAIPNIKDENFTEHEANLIQTPENINAFEKVKNARMNKTPLPVRASDVAHTAVGVELSGIEQEVAGKLAEDAVIMTLNEFTAFLVENTLGRLSNVGVPSGCGAKLKDIIVPKKGKRAAGEATKGRSGVSLVGRSAAIKQQYFQTVCEQNRDVTEQNPAFIKKNVSLDITYKVTDPKNLDDKNQPKVKTIRPKGEITDFPNFVVKEEFADRFPQSQTGIVSRVMSEQDFAKMEQIRAKYIAAVVSDGLATPIKFSAKFDAMLKEVKDAATVEQATNEDNMVD